MDKDKVIFYKELLLAEKEKTAKIIAEIGKTWSKTIRDSVGDISAYSTHPADLATDNDEREKETYMLERELRNMRKFESALKRIYNNIYGICSFCGKEISEERLRAIPYTELCIDCKRSREGANNNQKNH